MRTFAKKQVQPVERAREELRSPTPPSNFNSRFHHDFSQIAIHAEPGEPLTGVMLARIESTLGTSVGDVRIHRGPIAERAAEVFGAAAFTMGQDIFLGAGAKAPPYATRLLAHEVAHAVQQRGAFVQWPPPRTTPNGPEEREAEAASLGLELPRPGAAFSIAAAPAVGAVETPLRTFKEIWLEFDKKRDRLGLSNPAEATMLAREMATAPHELSDLINHGIEVVGWLRLNGEPEIAEHLLGHVRSAWMVEFVSEKGVLPRMSGLMGTSDPTVLIGLGKDAARAGQHDKAFRFFGVANEILSYYALDATEKRTTTLEGEKKNPTTSASAPLSDFSRRFHYSDLKLIYDQMREIYGFYFVLEREALAANDAKGAAVARAKASELQKKIKDEYSWGETQKTGPNEVQQPVEIAEATYTSTARGSALTLHGANSATTDLTQLPGLDDPKEIGNSVQLQNLGALQDALMAQTAVQAEIEREPDIRKEFGDQSVDLGDTTKRQKVWQIMYGVFKKRGDRAIGSLMALVGRYLKGFTHHTQYNVRDWGESYLESELPTDLASRAERDCGVYALNTAWDVYQTVKHSDAGLRIEFELVFSPDHVVLVIKDGNETYVASNDEVTAVTGDASQTIAKQFASQPGRGSVAFGRKVNVGSTTDREKTFKKGLWHRYTNEGVSFKPEAPRDRSDKRSEAERYAAAAERYYQTQKLYDDGQEAMRAALDTLDAARAKGDEATVLADRLPLLAEAARQLGDLFLEVGSYGRGMRGGVVIHHSIGEAPIVRVALLLLRRAELGVPAAPQDVRLIQFAAAVFQSAEVRNHPLFPKH